MTGELAGRLSAAVSEAEPCGPDLDLAEDPEYGQVMGSWEASLPRSYFEFEQSKRSEVDLPGGIRRLEALLDRSRDLRILVMLAKLRLLNREPAAFREILLAIEMLVSERWQSVPPSDYGDDFRVSCLEALDDPAFIVMPLQHVPMLTARRAQFLTFRAWQLADGTIQPREGETAPQKANLEAIFNETDLANVVEARELFEGIATSLKNIRAAVEQACGQDVKLDQLQDTIGKIAALVSGTVLRRDPSAAATIGGQDEAEEEGGDGPRVTVTLPPGAFTSLAAIRAALQGVENYFRRNEPSSPSLLLVAQAKQLVGKNLAESIQELVPNYSSSANIVVGGRQVFELPLDRLAGLIDSSPEESEEPGEIPELDSRAAALATLQQVAQHLRAREPSSAIPLLCDRARLLAEREFFSLLQEMLPRSALRNLDDD